MTRSCGKAARPYTPRHLSVGVIWCSTRNSSRMTENCGGSWFTNCFTSSGYGWATESGDHSRSCWPDNGRHAENSAGRPSIASRNWLRWTFDAGREGGGNTVVKHSVILRRSCMRGEKPTMSSRWLSGIGKKELPGSGRILAPSASVYKNACRYNKTEDFCQTHVYSAVAHSARSLCSFWLAARSRRA